MTVCTRCVMDTSAEGIHFDEAGVCSFCAEFEARVSSLLTRSDEERARELARLVSRVRAAGQGKRYDCIVGVSGGVDSSWALVKAVELGLRPLAVHMDNGWNSELAQNNISRLIDALGVDLYTYVIDWEEYRALMQAFFDADVIDVELLYDNAMYAVNYRQATQRGVKYILAGSNQATEGMHMPEGWNWIKFDKRNIQAIGRHRLRTFPAIGTLEYLWLRFIRRISWVSFLDYIGYDKSAALAELQDRFGFKPYLYKHYESVFTRFYQGFLLPEKFGVDKRRVHLSSLVVSGQLTRDEALSRLEGMAYPSSDELEGDKRYFCKKMGWTPEELQAYLRRPPRNHTEFASERWLWDALLRIWRKR